jgi:hypothetical protein
VRRLIVAVGVVAFATSCTGSEEKRPSTTDQSRGPQVAVEGLCEAETLASGGLLSEARRVFQDQSHAYLHTLAAQLQERDRALAAQLLETKQEVESSLQGAANPEVLSVQIGGLRAVVESAVAVVGLTNVGCFK